MPETPDTSTTYPQVLFAHRKPDRIISMDEYRQHDGYRAIEKAFNEHTHQEVKQILVDAVLLGRGGAAFPAGKKVMTVADDAPFPRYVVCNADEMEPGTFKDRVLIYTSPHLLIEGMIITGYAAKAERGIIFIRPEYEGAARILEREIDIAREAGFLGENLLGSDFNFDIDVHRSGGRYICGEVTAQLNALEGKRPNPRKPPPYPTEIGLWGKPTVTQNVETLCCMPPILLNGTDWFNGLALTETGAGTKIYGVSGRVNKPGCYELPMGVRLSEVIEQHAGGMTPGSEFKACLPGGASTSYITREHYDIPLDFNSLKEAGYRLGTAAIMVFGQTDCMVAVTLNLMEFFARESCGWCTPCREGIPYARDLLWRIEHGLGEEAFVPMLEREARHFWNAYCAFAPGAAAPLEGLLDHFQDELWAHIREKRCPFKAGK
jgi:NADH-quinone oxidoreductase subunit F